MKVSFDASATASPERFGHDLNAIVQQCETGRHAWHIEDLDALLASAWMQGKAKWDSQAKFAEKSYVDGIYPVLPKLWLVVAAEPSSQTIAPGRYCYDPGAALAILEQPAFVVVENKVSDGAFLGVVARTYAHERVATALDKLWLEVASGGGGGEIKKEAQRLLADKRIPPWRMVAVLDSDRVAPGPLPDKVEKLQNELREMGVKVWVLFKREIENYLPYSLLDPQSTSDPKRGVYVSFLTLSREQQDHFDMKNGLARTDNGEEVPSPEKQLFASVTDWHRARLVGGFGKRVGERFAEARLDRDELDQVCSTSPGELERLLDALESIL